MANHYSFDLETLGTTEDTHILSIGLCKFNLDTMKTYDTWELTIRDEQLNRNIDYETVLWWMDQSNEARQALTDKTKQIHTLPQALIEVSEIIGERDVVWGNGSIFDISILEHTYRQLVVPTPWKFWNVNDVRTIVAACRRITGVDPKTKIDRTGTHHAAKDDAKYQAELVIQSYKLLEGVSNAR